MKREANVGDRVRIIDPDALLQGADGYISHINKTAGRITIMIPANRIAPEDRNRFVLKRTRHGNFVPVVLLDGEWEHYGTKTIITPRGKE